MKFLRVNNVISIFRLVLALAIIFFVPLFFAFVLQTNNAFELNKTVLFRLLVLLFLFFSFKQFKNLPVFLKKNFIFVLLFFLSSLLISTYFSINSQISFLGEYYRQEGLLSYSYYFLFFLLITLFLKESKNNLAIVLWTCVLSSLVVCIYGFMQIFGMDPFLWIESTEMRATSTFGQPNNFGSYLLFVIPLTIYFIFKYKNKVLRLFLGVLFLAQLTVLYYSFSISAWIGLGVGVIFLLLVISKQIKLINNKIKLISLLIFILLLTIFSFNSGIVKAKINNLFNPETGSTAARIQFWNAAVEAVKEKPIIGYGLDTQSEILLKSYKPEWALHSNVNVNPSRAHNLFLDILLTQGVLGLIAHILLWGCLLYLIVKNIKNNQEKGLNLAILTSLVAYFVYLQFNFPHVTTWIYFWLFFALILSLTNKNELKREFNIPKTVKVVLFVLLILFSYRTIPYEIKKLQADNYFMEMRQANLENRYTLMIKMYDYIKGGDKSYGIYDKTFVEMIISWSRYFKDNEYFNSMVKDRLKKILEQIKTDNFSDLKTKAQIYEFLTYYDESYFTKTDEVYSKLIETSPNMPLAHRFYAEYLDRQGRKEEAKKEYELCLDNLPDIDDERMNWAHRGAVKQEFDFCSVLDGENVVE